MISVGAFFGGPEQYLVHEVVKDLMRYCKSARMESSDSATVNIVYQLPGSVSKPEHTGLRKGKFSKSEKTLLVLVPLEASWVSSDDEDRIRRHICHLATDALELATDEFQRKGIEYDMASDAESLKSWLITSANDV